MTKLQVQLFGKLGANLGSDLELNFIEKVPTIRKVIKILIQKDPRLESLLLRGNDLRRGTILLINGHVVDRSEWGLDRKLSAQDRVTVDRLGFLPIVGGGCFLDKRRSDS
ncbi:MoaD/ThiS family protein [Candidatus Pacearchaeota archaeon]|nr:MoaD/ThiS family protein [Candidatus Pacearchaeota archaeon]